MLWQEKMYNLTIQQNGVFIKVKICVETLPEGFDEELEKLEGSDDNEAKSKFIFRHLKLNWCCSSNSSIDELNFCSKEESTPEEVFIALEGLEVGGLIYIYADLGDELSLENTEDTKF